MRQKRQLKTNDRNTEAVRKAEVERQQVNVINQFLNDKDDQGNLKYPLAKQMHEYYKSNIDPVLNSVRLSNSLLHEIRWHKDLSNRYLSEYQSTGAVTMSDKFGKIMTRAECYTAHIAEDFTVPVVISKLREHLVQGLLPLADNDNFTLQDYSDYVTKVEVVLKGMGYDLFPEKLVIIEPR